MRQALPSAAEVVRRDLSDICANVADELGMMAGKRLLITGGGGFLGYYFVHAVCHWNRQSSTANQIALTVYENFVRGAQPWLDELRRTDPFILVEHDITRPLPDDMPDFDYIVHAASIASPIYYRKYPIQTIDANVNGLRRLLDYAVARRDGGRAITGMLFFSTSEIYGDPPADSIPTPEHYRGNVSCTGPRACYDESKRLGETLCVNFASEYDVPVRVARPFNNYGPGLKITDRRVIPDFARDMLAGRNITMLSNGSPKRTFCYITDAIAGYVKILTRGRNGEAYNIGVEEPEISMLDLAHRCVELGRSIFGYTGEVVFANSEDAAYLTDNPNRRCPVIAKARAELGYDPRVDLPSGLERTLIWYRDNSTAEDA
ncbi:MAG: NAD-dependent epimerase/dehydratase [Gemmatimonadetes bacterium]|nr:NAD-dependent epimerase/dehydratase [Gemmatimonadota bacterium]